MATSKVLGWPLRNIFPVLDTFCEARPGQEQLRQLSLLEKAFAGRTPEGYWGKARDAKFLETLENADKLFSASAYAADFDYTFRLQRVLCQAVVFFNFLVQVKPGTPKQAKRYATIMRTCADQLYVICDIDRLGALGLREFISQCPHPLLAPPLIADLAVWQARDSSDDAFLRETAHAGFARTLASVLVLSQRHGAGYPDSTVDHKTALECLLLILQEWPAANNQDYLTAAKVALLAGGRKAAQGLLLRGLRKMKKLKEYGQMVDLERMLGEIRSPRPAGVDEAGKGAQLEIPLSEQPDLEALPWEKVTEEECLPIYRHGYTHRQYGLAVNWLYTYFLATDDAKRADSLSAFGRRVPTPTR